MQLQVSHLAVSRGGLVVLEGVSFTLSAGRALILRGSNGTGKTTLLRTIAGLQLPVQGQISLPPESLAYASHADGLKPSLTVTENLRFWAQVYGAPPEELAQAVARMDLSRLQDRPAAQLSAGQKRRLGLARLLVTGRPIWLLDEPTVSLDAESVALFAGVLRDHLARGGAALIATHIDLGLPEAEVLDLNPLRAWSRPSVAAGFDESFDEALS